MPTRTTTATGTPRVGDSAGARRGLEHVPSWPGMLHDSLGPSQGVLQHTPSTQNRFP